MTYADTPNGVREMLNAWSTLTPKEIEDAELIIDPQVAGCWLVVATSKGEVEYLLVYVAEHRDAPGLEEVEMNPEYIETLRRRSA
jgi:hypothetical protein